jgi:hypothetical protein
MLSYGKSGEYLKFAVEISRMAIFAAIGGHLGKRVQKDGNPKRKVAR